MLLGAALFALLPFDTLVLRVFLQTYLSLPIPPLSSPSPLLPPLLPFFLHPSLKTPDHPQPRRSRAPPDALGPFGVILSLQLRVDSAVLKWCRFSSTMIKLQPSWLDQPCHVPGLRSVYARSGKLRAVRPSCRAFLSQAMAASSSLANDPMLILWPAARAKPPSCVSLLLAADQQPRAGARRRP